MTTLLVQSPEPTESWEENQVYKVVFLSPHANHGTCAPLPASYMYPITRNFKIFKVAVNPRQFEISDSYPISDSDSQFCPSIYLHIIWSSDEKQHPSFLSTSEVNCGCQYHHIIRLRNAWIPITPLVVPVRVSQKQLDHKGSALLPSRSSALTSMTSGLTMGPKPQPSDHDLNTLKP